MQGPMKFFSSLPEVSTGLVALWNLVFSGKRVLFTIDREMAKEKNSYLGKKKDIWTNMVFSFSAE